MDESQIPRVKSTSRRALLGLGTAGLASTMVVAGGSQSAQATPVALADVPQLPTSKLLVRSLNNELEDAGFEISPTTWVPTGGATIGTITPRVGTTGSGATLHVGDTVQQGSSINVLPGERWFGSLWVNIASATGSTIVMSAQYLVGGVATSKNFFSRTVSSAGTWKPMGGAVVIPAGVTSMKIKVALTGGSGTVIIDDLVVRRLQSTFSVRDFGAIGDGVTDDTDAVQAALDAAAGFFASVEVPMGLFAVRGITIQAQTALIGTGSETVRFPVSGRNSSMLVALDGDLKDPSTPASHAPLISAIGNGITLRNVTISGYSPGVYGETDRSNFARVVGLELNGNECRLERVRVIYFAQVGIDVQLMLNTSWTDVYVDNCGTDAGDVVGALPAVQIKSPSITASTNFNQVRGLTIEHSWNAALEIGVGSNIATDYVEYLDFFGLHVESTADGAGGQLNRGPLITIGNVRSIHFYGAQILGVPSSFLGDNASLPSAAILYDQQIDDATLRSGRSGGGNADTPGSVEFFGGTIIQRTLGAQDVSGGTNPTSPPSIRLHRGSNFVASGVRLIDVASSGIQIDFGFKDAYIDPGCTIKMILGATVQVADSRSPTPPFQWAQTLWGNVQLNGHLSTATSPSALAPTSLTAVVAGSPTPLWLDTSAPGSDVSGCIRFGSGTAPVAGAQVKLSFSYPYGEVPAVALTPMNAATAALGLYVDSSTGYLQICTQNAPSASQSVGVYRASYVVLT